jgi:hypothetical protein
MPFPTAEDCIQLAEDALGVRLPTALRDHLLIENGGEFTLCDRDWTLFPVEDTSDRKRAARTANHLVLETHSARDWRDFPPAAVAIAIDGSSNYLILLSEDGDSTALGTQVYLWDHEDGSVTPVAMISDLLG